MNYLYEGIELYVQDESDPIMNQKLRVIQNAVESVRIYHHDEHAVQNSLRVSAMIDDVRRVTTRGTYYHWLQNNTMHQTDHSTLPFNTPENYEQAFIDRVKNQNTSYYHIYIPLAAHVSDDPDLPAMYDIKHLSSVIKELLCDLFHVTDMTTYRASNEDDFNDSTARQII